MMEWFLGLAFVALVIALVYKMLTKKETLEEAAKEVAAEVTATAKKAADVNKDGKVNIDDAKEVVKKVRKKKKAE